MHCRDTVDTTELPSRWARHSGHRGEHSAGRVSEAHHGGARDSARRSQFHEQRLFRRRRGAEGSRRDSKIEAARPGLATEVAVASGRLKTGADFGHKEEEVGHREELIFFFIKLRDPIQ